MVAGRLRLMITIAQCASAVPKIPPNSKAPTSSPVQAISGDAVADQRQH